MRLSVIVLILKIDLDPTLKRYEHRMRDQGYRDDSVEDYLKAVKLCLRVVKKTSPSINDAIEYHSNMSHLIWPYLQ